MMLWGYQFGKKEKEKKSNKNPFPTYFEDPILSSAFIELCQGFILYKTYVVRCPSSLQTNANP